MRSNSQQPRESPAMLRRLGTIGGLTLVLMTLYELIKQWVFPNITLWQSHIVTIVFSSLVATGGAYIVLRQIDALYRKANAELERYAHTEQALRESERRYKEQLRFMQVLLDSIPVPIFYKDAEGVYQGCNQAFETYLGRAKEEIIGQSVYGISPPELADRYKVMDDELFARGGVQVYEASVQHADDSQHNVIFHKATFEQADGTLGGLVGIILDITEQKQIERTLEERESLYRSLVQTMQDGLTLLEDDRVVYASDRAQAIFGYTEEAYQQLSSVDFIAPEDRARGGTATDDDTPFPNQTEFWIVRPDGTRRLIRNRYTALPGEGPHCAHLIVTTDITHQQYAEAALRESEERLRMLVESADDIIVLQDLEGRYLYYNCPEHYGIQLNNVIGKTPIDIFGPDIGNRIITRIHQVVASEQALSSENCVEWQGGPLWFQDHIYPVRDEENRVTAVATISRNITERKCAEQTLEHRVAQLALLNDIAGKITSVLELEEVFDRVTSLVQTTFRYHHVGIFTLDNDDRELVMRARSGDFAELFPLEHRIKLGAGMVGWVGLHGRTLLANRVEEEPHYVNFYPDVIPTQAELSVPLRMGGEVLGVLDMQSPERDAFDENDVVVMKTLASQIAVAIANAQLYQDAQREIHEREQAEAALRESEERYHIVSDIISDVAYAFEITPAGELKREWITGAFDRFNGLLASSESPDTHWQQWIHPDDVAELHAALDTLISGKPAITELRLQLPDGHICWLNTRNHPVWDEDARRVVRIIGAAQDVTEQKKMEQLMLRTERLAAMGHITGTLAHEIKNPLQAIQNNLELLIDFPLEPDERGDALKISHREVERLIEITRRILSFTQPNKATYQEIALRDHVRQTADLVKQSAQKAAVEITIDISADLPPVFGAVEQIDQVLLNLILNAIEAMPDGGLLTITAQEIDGYVSLTLTNTGPPIPPHHLTHIFEPFFTTKPTGAGLGLFISHYIVQQHEGTLSAANLPDDQGVAFELLLPRADPASKKERIAS